MSFQHSPNHILIESIITKIGGIIPFERFLMDMNRPRIERECKVTLKNIFIVRYSLDTRLNPEKTPYLRIHWSADNHPICEKIYANTLNYDIPDLLIDYRDSKLNTLLVD